MNDLLFYALILALLYYFFYYLPSHKKLTQNQPILFETKATQTETIIRSEEPGAIQCSSAQFVSKEDQELENTLDSLIKSIQEFKQTLD